MAIDFKSLLSGKSQTTPINFKKLARGLPGEKKNILTGKFDVEPKLRPSPFRLNLGTDFGTTRQTTPSILDKKEEVKPLKFPEDIFVNAGDVAKSTPSAIIPWETFSINLENLKKTTLSSASPTKIPPRKTPGEKEVKKAGPFDVDFKFDVQSSTPKNVIEPTDREQINKNIELFNKTVGDNAFKLWSEGRTENDIRNRKAIINSTYDGFAQTVSRDLKTGFMASAGSTVRGFEWLAPNVLKPRFKDLADNIGTQVDVLSIEDPKFWNQLVQGAGSASAFFVPGVAVGGISVGLGMSARASLFFGNSVMTTLEAMAEAGEVYSEITKQGLGKDEASKRASATFWANAVLIGLTNKFGILSDKATGGLKRSLTSSILEGGQELVQQIIQNTETGREWDEGIWTAGAIGAIIGLPMGMITQQGVGGMDQEAMRRALEEKYSGTPTSIPVTAPTEGATKIPVKVDFKALVKQIEVPVSEETKRTEPLTTSTQKVERKNIVDLSDRDSPKGVTDFIYLKDTGKIKKGDNISVTFDVGGTKITETGKVTVFYGGKVRTFTQNGVKQYVPTGWMVIDVSGKGLKKVRGENVVSIDKVTPSIQQTQPIATENSQERAGGIKDINDNQKITYNFLGEKTETTVREARKDIKEITKSSAFIGEEGASDQTEARLEVEVIQKALDKVGEVDGRVKAEAEITEEFAIAEAGRRIPVEGQAEPIVQKSTFPQWIPLELRRKPLLDAVRQNILDGTVPTKAAEKRLYDVVQKRIAKQSGTEVATKEEEIDVSKVQFEMPPPTKNESKEGISSGGYYASKGEFNVTDIPKHVSNIEMPEMIKLIKELLNGNVPFIKNYPQALGAFYPDPNNPRIGINPRAFEDEVKAAQTLAHEIGHLIDFIPEMTIKRGNILNRLESLVQVRKGIFGQEELIKKRKNVMASISNYNRQEQKGKLTEKQIERRELKISELNSLNKQLVIDKEFRDELKALTQFWRPFKPAIDHSYTAYRNSSPELYADFISVLFNRPDLAMTKAPKFFNRFFEFLDNKPEVKKSYFEIKDFIGGGREKVLDAREADIRRGFQTAKELEINKMAEGMDKSFKEKASSMARKLNKAFIEENVALIEKEEEFIKNGGIVKPENNLAIKLEELSYIKNEVSNVYDSVEGLDTKLKDNKLTDEDFSTYLFFKRVTGDRAAKANPYGHTPKTAQDGLNRMKEKQGKEKFKILEDSAIKLKEIFDKEMMDGAKAGLYDEAFVEELISGDNIYSTFKVLDYVLSGSVSANLIAQVGTFKDLGQTYQSTIAKMVAIRVASHKNDFRKVSGESFLNNFKSDEVLNAKIPEFSRAEVLKAGIDARTGGAPQFKNNKAGQTLELITWRDGGKIKGVYVDPEIAASYKYDTNTNNQIVRETIGLINNELFRKAYIDYSIRFIVRNPVRDLRQAWRALKLVDLQGTGEFSVGFFDFVKAVKNAYPEARAFAKGEKTETIEKVLDNKILGVDEDYKMTGADLDESTALSREMRKRGLRLEQIQKDNPSKNPFVHLGNFIMQVGKTSEAITKITAFQLIEQRLNQRNGTINKATAQYIRNNIGTPNWKKGGTATPTTNVIYMFSNVMLQGYKRTYNLYANPNTGSGYLWRTIQIAILPKLLMFMAGSGLMGDELEKIMKGFGSYSKRNYLIFPLGIDEQGKSIGITIPMDYDERLITSVMWAVMNTIKNQSIDGADLWNLLSAEMPSLTNTINIPLTWSEYFRGINPRDNWMGRDVLTDDEFIAGGAYSLKPMLRWTWDQILGGVLFKVGIRDRFRNQTLLEKASKIVPLNAFLTISDYGHQEEINKAQEPADKEAATKNIKKTGIIIDSLRDFYKSGDSEDEIEKYISQAFNKFYGDKMYTKSENTNFTKSFMREALKAYNNSRVTALVYSQSINEQKIAIKVIKESVSQKDYNKIRAMLLNSRLISEKTWGEAINEFNQEKNK